MTSDLERALQDILDEVDGKADASCEPGSEKLTPNDYMRIEMAAERAMALARKSVALISETPLRWIPVTERRPDLTNIPFVFDLGCATTLACDSANDFASYEDIAGDKTVWFPLPRHPEAQK